MKNAKRRLAVILSLMMIISSFEVLGVFAEEVADDQGTEPAVTTEEAAEVTEPAEKPAEETAEEPVEEAVTEAEKNEGEEAGSEGEVNYDIKYEAATGGTVSNSSDSGSDITGSTATPSAGYTFDGWYFNDTSISTSAALDANAVKSALDGKTEGTFTAKFKAAAPAIQDLYTLSSSQRVYLRWKNPAPKDSVTYTITTYNTLTNSKVKTETVKGSSLSVVKGYYQYVVKGLSADINYLTGKYPDYKFTVTAKSDSGSVSATATDSPVRTIAYKIRIKSAAKLKSHNSIKGTVKVKKGQYIYAYGFGCGGKYLFKNEKGGLYFCNFTRTSKRSCVYSKGTNYTDEEATLFVNDAGLSSGNNYLVWVNTYTQHIYLFQGSAGHWTLNHPDKVSAECSTGKASSPSPTSAATFGRQTVWKKLKTRHGIPFWTCYSDINAIHAKRSGWKMGKPASNGCVRNLKQNAQKVYNHAVKKKTKVYLY